MKVYIVTNEAYPYGMAAASRITCYAKALLYAGLEVEVVNYFRTENSKSAKNTESCGIFEGIPFRYIAGTTIRSGNMFLRKLNDALDRIRLIKYLQDNMKQGDCILAYFQQNVISKNLLSFAHKNGYPIVRDLCEYPYASSAIKPSTQKRCSDYMKNIFPRYDGSICISQALLELAMQYSPNGRHIKIPILIDETKKDFGRIEQKQLGFPYLFHAGTLYQQKDGILDVLTAFAKALPSLPSGTKYLFTGSIEKSPDAQSIREKIKELQLQKRVEFIGYLPDEELLKYEKGTTLFIVNKIDNIQNHYCFPTKIGEYLLSGNPVLTTDIGETNYYLAANTSAYIVRQSSISAMAEAIVNAFTNVTLSKSIGLKGRKVAMDSFSVISQSSTLAQYFKSLK